MIDALIEPHLSPLSKNKFPKSIQQLISQMDKDSFTKLNKSINIYWRIRISLNESNSTEYIYTPFLKYFDILAKNENSAKSLSDLPRLSDFCEEKRIIELEDTLKFEISWDGSSKITKEKNTKNYIKLFVKSPNLVFLDNFKFNTIVILSPYILIGEEVSVEKIKYYYDQFQKRETTQFSILELTSLSKLFVRYIEGNGLLINKGTIITGMNGFLNFQQMKI